MNDWMFKILRWVLPLVSGPLRDSLMKFARQFREDAKTTENKMDDLLADVICWLVGVE